MLKKLDYDNILVPIGDHKGEDRIYYNADTVFWDGKTVKFIYDEWIYENDEIIPNKTNRRILNKYSYSINPDTYEVKFEGKVK